MLRYEHIFSSFFFVRYRMFSFFALSSAFDDVPVFHNKFSKQKSHFQCGGVVEGIIWFLHHIYIILCVFML